MLETKSEGNQLILPDTPAASSESPCRNISAPAWLDDAKVLIGSNIIAGSLGAMITCWCVGNIDDTEDDPGTWKTVPACYAGDAMYLSSLRSKGSTPL